MRPGRRWLMEMGRRVLVARYVRAYRRRRPVDAVRLAHGEALACMRGLVRVAESRTAAAGGAPVNPLDASPYGDRLAARFAALTGIRPQLPPARARAAASARTR
jgi:hypothetical protein